VRHGLTGEQESRRAGESGGERADMLRMRRRKERATVPIEWADLSTSAMENVGGKRPYRCNLFIQLIFKEPGQYL